LYAVTLNSPSVSSIVRRASNSSENPESPTRLSTSIVVPSGVVTVRRAERVRR
jgi:hypothetical protein